MSYFSFKNELGVKVGGFIPGIMLYWTNCLVLS